MLIRFVFRCGLAALLLLAALTAFAQDKVVFQVSDDDVAKWNLTLNNARNLQAELGADKVAIEIVAYGPGIAMLKADSPVAGRVLEAVAQKIQVAACQNTMAAKKLAPADMVERIGYVRSGVTELVRKQQQGYAYIKP
jgi:intracellular sulfur oxidation DsrE/DsrF family protein